MKKTLFVAAIAAMLVFAFAGSAFAAVAAVGDQNGGYLTWTQANGINAQADGLTVADTDAQLLGPHSGYTVNTAKCGVCHSVHGAASAGVALTKAGNTLGDPNGVCVFCHAIDANTGAPEVAMYISNGTDHASLSGVGSKKGGGCVGGCHNNSPHGANGSQFSLLKMYMLNNRADANIIAQDADTNSSLAGVIAAGTLTDTTKTDPGFKRALTMATALTCMGNGTGTADTNGGGCHYTGAFASMSSQNVVKTGAAGVYAYKTGHPVYQANHTDWSENGSAQFAGPGDPTPSTGGTIAYNGVTGTTVGCDACHDAVNTQLGKTAFPHNQVNENGSPTDATNPTVLWMNKAANSGATKSFVTADPTDTYKGAIVDGACLKCHFDGTNGVGQDY